MPFETVGLLLWDGGITLRIIPFTLFCIYCGQVLSMLTVSLCLSLCLCLNLSVCFSLSVCLSVSSLTLFLSYSLTVLVWLSVCQSVCLCLAVCLSVSALSNRNKCKRVKRRYFHCCGSLLWASSFKICLKITCQSERLWPSYGSVSLLYT